MKLLMNIAFIAVSSFSIAQSSNENLVNQSLLLLCNDEVILECIDQQTGENDTICFFSETFNSTEVVKASNNIYYRISSKVDVDERKYSAILEIGETFNRHEIILLDFKVLKSEKSNYVGKVGYIRCQIVEGSKISSVDARYK